MEQTQYNEETQRALLRVRKMLALANDAAASEGERDNALRMAHATLAKYNLSVTDAKQATGPGERRKDVWQSRSRPWIITCTHAVAELFFCEYFIIRRGNNVSHYFIGREANTVTAMEIAAYVTTSILKEARRASAGDETFISSFCKGAAHRVYYRCQELRREAEEESRRAAQPKSTGTALVLASVYAQERDANLALMEQLGIRLRKGGKSRERGSQGDAYRAGHEYGGRVSLHRQVGGGGETRRLK
jgi:hypothetical protein